MSLNRKSLLSKNKRKSKNLSKKSLASNVSVRNSTNVENHAKKCNGTGLIRSNEIAQVISVVRGEIKEYCNNTFTGLIKDYLKKKSEDQANTEHP